MLLRQVTGLLLVLITLLAMAAPVAAAPANECNVMPQPNVPSQRLGRPCVTLDFTTVSATGETACIPFGATGLYDFDRDPVCVVYIVLVPLADGGRVGSELDFGIVWLETNGAPGLQTAQTDRPRDNMFLL